MKVCIKQGQVGAIGVYTPMVFPGSPRLVFFVQVPEECLDQIPLEVRVRLRNPGRATLRTTLRPRVSIRPGCSLTYERLGDQLRRLEIQNRGQDEVWRGHKFDAHYEVVSHLVPYFGQVTTLQLKSLEIQ